MPPTEEMIVPNKITTITNHRTLNADPSGRKAYEKCWVMDVSGAAVEVEL